MCEMCVWSVGGMNLTGEILNTEIKPVPVPFCAPQVLSGLAWH